MFPEWYVVKDSEYFALGEGGGIFLTFGLLKVWVIPWLKTAESSLVFRVRCRLQSFGQQHPEVSRMHSYTVS